MPLVSVDVEIQVWCECGEGLCRYSAATNGGVVVEPCRKCVENAKNEGEEDGHSKGYAEAENIFSSQREWE